MNGFNHELDKIMATWPATLVNPLIPHNGRIRATEIPGLGMEVKPEVWTHPAAITRSTST